MNQKHIMYIMHLEDQKLVRAKKIARKKLRDANKRATKLEEKASKLRKRAAAYAQSVQNQEKNMLKRKAKTQTTTVERRLKKIGL